MRSSFSFVQDDAAFEGINRVFSEDSRVAEEERLRAKKGLKHVTI